MTATEIRNHLHSKIDQLNNKQLREFQEMLSAVLNDSSVSKKRKAGTMKGLVAYMADDFDAPLDDFKDYMFE